MGVGEVRPGSRLQTRETARPLRVPSPFLLILRRPQYKTVTTSQDAHKKAKWLTHQKRAQTPIA
jgi:hypothetical protein